MNNIDIRRDLPESIKRDTTVAAVADTTTHELERVNARASCLVLLPHLKALSVRLLDLLAKQWHVDFYDTEWRKEQKAEAIATSIAWHRIKGTPKAVELAVGRVVDGATVREAWEYGGEPYHFRVDLITSPIVAGPFIAKLLTLIEHSKNARSHLDGVGFTRESGGRLYVGAALKVHKSVKAYPAKHDIPDRHATTYTGAGIYIRKKVIING